MGVVTVRLLERCSVTDGNIIACKITFAVDKSAERKGIHAIATQKNVNGLAIKVGRRECPVPFAEKAL